MLRLMTSQSRGPASPGCEAKVFLNPSFLLLLLLVRIIIRSSSSGSGSGSGSGCGNGSGSGSRSGSGSSSGSGSGSGSSRSSRSSGGSSSSSSGSTERGLISVDFNSPDDISPVSSLLQVLWRGAQAIEQHASRLCT